MRRLSSTGWRRCISDLGRFSYLPQAWMPKAQTDGPGLASFAMSCGKNWQANLHWINPILGCVILLSPSFPSEVRWKRH